MSCLSSLFLLIFVLLGLSGYYGTLPEPWAGVLNLATVVCILYMVLSYAVVILAARRVLR